MDRILAILMPIVVGINGVLLIALEIIDSAKKKKQENRTEEEKEREEIKTRWKSL